MYMNFPGREGMRKWGVYAKWGRPRYSVNYLVLKS